MELTISEPYIARPYSRLAETYDLAIGIRSFTGTRAAFERLIRRYAIPFASAADIGCGTGLFASYLNQCWGIPVFAVDRSPDMLAVAARNCAGQNVCLLQQDIRCLRLPSPVDLITANFDTLNHILEDIGLKSTFRRVWENLNPGGHFIFDLITPCQPRRRRRYLLAAASGKGRVEQRVQWNPWRRILSISVVMTSPLCRGSTVEAHRERAYSPIEVGRWLLDAGFLIRGVYDATTLRFAGSCPPRVIIVAQKPMKGMRALRTNKLAAPSCNARTGGSRMYLIMRDELGQAPEGWSTFQGDLSGFRSAEDRVYEDDFEAVLTVLAGPSPWQEYIRENLRVARQNLPRRAFRVVNSEEFVRTMRALGEDGDMAHIPGVTDKRAGIITMQEFFGKNSHQTFLGAALHEAVHLVSHPAGRSRTQHSTAWGILGEGLLEGLVECVTRDILSTQGIALAQPGLLGHQQRVPVARELLRRLSVPLLARVLFGGDFQQFLMVMNHTYSPAGWTEIKMLTTSNNPARAIQRMNELSAVEEQRHNEDLKRRFSQIR
jgi:SAM-dependent methyltransferase